MDKSTGNRNPEKNPSGQHSLYGTITIFTVPYFRDRFAGR